MIFPSLKLIIKCLRSRVLWANTGSHHFFYRLNSFFNLITRHWFFFLNRLHGFLYFIFFTRLSWSHDMASKFGKLTQVGPHLFFLFFSLGSFCLFWFFKKFHPWIFDLLRTGFRDFFIFVASDQKVQGTSFISQQGSALVFFYLFFSIS